VNARGRSCPTAYRYRPEALAQPARLSADTLFVVGGLYGNLAALRAVLERARRERDGTAAVVFNGDFHWLDVDPEDFRAISETVLAQHALEAMEPGDAVVRQQVGWRGRPTTPAEVRDWFRRTGVSVLASTHTGLPYAQDFLVAGRRRLVVNNGAAGLGNFAGTTYGVLTRLSSNPRPPPDSLYGITIGALRCDALPVRFDPRWWRARFLAQWPPGSPGHRSYFSRVTGGTPLRLEQAARGNVTPTAMPGRPVRINLY